jgi:hypothetical protein
VVLVWRERGEGAGEDEHYESADNGTTCQKAWNVCRVVDALDCKLSGAVHILCNSREERRTSEDANVAFRSSQS